MITQVEAGGSEAPEPASPRTGQNAAYRLTLGICPGAEAPGLPFSPRACANPSDVRGVLGTAISEWTAALDEVPDNRLLGGPQ